MSELETGSVDVVFFSPPYNIKTSYEDFNDDLELDDYLRLINSVVKESVRVLRKRGRLIIEVADSVFVNGQYVQLAGLIQKSAMVNPGIFLESRHINFVKTKKFFELPGHGFDKNHITSQEAHSNCHQILVFKKSKVMFKEGEILYINYEASVEHPCAEPRKMIDFILKKYFKSGMKVLDPFMGTSNLGTQVVKNGGVFFGYEMVKEFYDISKKKLDLI